MRKILITNQSAGYLTTEIANAFIRSGKYDEVVLAVGNEISPLLKLDERVIVEKMPKYDKTSISKRTMSWFQGAKWIVSKVKKKYKGFELFLISNPPTIAFATMFLKNRYSTLIYDVYPNGLVDGGFIKKNNLIYQLWARRNKKFFGNADHVFTITEGMKNTISDYCPIEKIEVVELWSNPNLPYLNVSQNDNKFILENGLLGKFIIMYSGNIGKGHDLDVLVDVAQKLQGYKNIVFLFVGDGYLKPIIEQKANEYGLNNVIMLPYQERSMLPYSLSCSDLAVVSTNKQSGKVCIPSKIFDLIKLGRPIFCIAEPDSDISQFVNKHKVGKSFSREQVDKMVDFILTMYENQDELVKFSKASLCASLHYTSDLAKKFIK